MNETKLLTAAITSDLLKSKLTNAMLKSVFTDAMVVGDAPENLDDITRSGVYRTETTKSPIYGHKRFGFVFAIVHGIFHFQLFIAVSNGVGATTRPELYGRLKWHGGGTVWGEWCLLVTPTPLSAAAPESGGGNLLHLNALYAERRAA